MVIVCQAPREHRKNDITHKSSDESILKWVVSLRIEASEIYASMNLVLFPRSTFKINNQCQKRSENLTAENEKEDKVKDEQQDQDQVDPNKMEHDQVDQEEEMKKNKKKKQRAEKIVQKKSKQSCPTLPYQS
jgi:Mg-chelatase subunit ChlI